MERNNSPVNFKSTTLAFLPRNSDPRATTQCHCFHWHETDDIFTVESRLSKAAGKRPNTI